MQHDNVLKKLNFELFTPRVRERGVCRQNICYHVATFCDSILFDMQHDHVLKKLDFDLLNPSPGSRVCWVCGHNICYHVTTLVVLLNLICNLTMVPKC